MQVKKLQKMFNSITQPQYQTHNLNHSVPVFSLQSRAVQNYESNMPPTFVDNVGSVKIDAGPSWIDLVNKNNEFGNYTIIKTPEFLEM